MKIELILDEQGFFRITRMGFWIHVHDYEDGHDDWYHDSEVPQRIARLLPWRNRMAVKPEYSKWIIEHLEGGDGTGLCAIATAAMVEAFPELKRVRGHYICPIWGPREHWWCVGPDGIVVDPTAAQFPSMGIGAYLEHVEGSPEPTGKCHNCGGYIYNGDSFCDEECEQETMMAMGFTHKTPEGAWAR